MTNYSKLPDSTNGSLLTAALVLTVVGLATNGTGRCAGKNAPARWAPLATPTTFRYHM